MKRKRAVSLLLALSLVLGMVVVASPPPSYAAETKDGFGFNTDPPSDFDAGDGKNPYGKGRVALNPLREVSIMGPDLTPAVYDANDTVKDRYDDDVAAVTNWQDVITKEIERANGDGKIYFLAGLKTVAYDPNGTGKDDHVACIGMVGRQDVLTSYYNAVKVWVFNAKTGQQVGRTVTLIEDTETVMPRRDDYFSFNQKETKYRDASGLLTIAAGDMNGDGQDELYAYRPGTYTYDYGGGSKTNGAIVRISGGSSSEYLNNLSGAPAGSVVGLALGDADGDGKDELAYALPTSQIYLYGDTGKKWETRVYSDYKGYCPALAFGNLNGDNKEDLVAAFSMSEYTWFSVHLFSQDRGGALTAATLKCGGSYGENAGVPVITCFAKRGMKEPDSIFVNGDSYRVERGELTYDGSYSFGSSNYGEWIHSAVAGNFDGNKDGREDVLYSRIDSDRYNNGSRISVEPYETYWEGSKRHSSQTGTRLYYLREYGQPFLALAAPDVDDDTMFIEYRSKEYTFDNPKIISILQAAPYFEDLSDYYYDATGGTSFGTSSGSGGGSTQSTSVSAHASLKVGAEFGFIVTASVYVETTASFEWSSEYSVMETTTLETRFNGGKQENNVVLLGIPVTLYTYDVYGPNGKGGYDKDQMVISIPGDPQYSIITVEQYNAAARAGGLVPISDSQVHATPGDPASYYQDGSGEMSGLKNLVKFDGEFVSVGGSGSATTTRSITKDTEESITDTFAYDIDITSGAEVAGSGGSIGGGFGQSNSSVQVTTTGVVREVEVANVPEQGQGLYSFQWNMAIWDTKVGNQTVPVVGYVTKGVKQPPALPGAFTVTETTTDSVKLGWEESTSASSYEIYQYFKDSSVNQYVRVATLDGDVTEYTVNGLKSGGTYEYVICSLDAAGQRSVYSAPITAVTLPGDGQSPAINQSPQDANVRPGANASFRVDAQPAAGSSGLTYTWYESAKGGSVWKQVGDSSSTLTLPQVDTKMDGSRYRCVVSQTIGGQQVLVYSDVATLHVGQGATTTTLTMDKNSGKAGYSVETKDTETVIVPKTREITVDGNTTSYVEYAATGGTPAVDKIYRASDGTYYVLEGLDETAGTATKAVQLSQKPSEFKADEGVDIPEGVTPGSLTGSEQGVFTIPAGSAASGTREGDYYVYTAEITETGTDGETTTVTRTVYAKESTNPTTYYTLSQQITGESDNVKTTYTMTAVTQTISNVQPVMVAGTLIVKGENGIGDVVASIPTDPGTDTYTTYEVYNGGTDGSTKVYRADGVYYLLTFDETETNKVTARAALTVETYDTLQSADGTTYTGITPDEAVTEEVTKEIIVLEPKNGDPVTLTASVAEANGSEKPTGTVTFRITNTDTGTSKNQTVTLSGGKAELNWTPDAAGVYSITASYNGDSSFLTSTSAIGTYYAIADGGNEFTSLVLRPDKTSVEYGDKVILTLYEAKTGADGTVTETVSNAANVKYTVRVENPNYDSSQPESETNKKYLEETISPTWAANKVPGTYVFTAKTQDNRSASAAVTVTRRALDVKVDDKEVPMGTVPSASDLIFQRAGTEDTNAWAGSENYTSLFTVSTTLTASSGSGVYQVTPVMVDSPNEDQLAAFNSRYTWTPVSGQWTVLANTHSVKLTHGVNGTVVGHVGDNFDALDGSAPHGAKLSFKATPDPGFEVSAWTVNGTAVTESGGNYTLSADKKTLTVKSLDKDLTVNVTFSNQRHQVTFIVDMNGGGNVSAINGSSSIGTGGYVTGGTSVTFIATPYEGKIVKSWSVNGTIQKNEDNSNYVGNELTLDNISEDINVVVAFENEVSYTVTFSAVNTKGEAAQSGAVTLSSEGLNEQNQAVKGSKVVLKATPGPGSAILEWEEYDGQKWTSLAGSQGSFTISNLQGDRNIRVQINESVTTHKLTFEVVDMDSGDPVTDAGTLTATIGGTPVNSGDDCLTSSKVVFTFKPAQSYEVAEWRVDSATVQEGLDKLTYTIDSLLANTTVRMAVHKKPQVTISNAEAAKGGVTVEGMVNGKKAEIASGGYADYGKDLTVTLKPEVGYEVKDGDSMTAVPNSDDRYYTISRVTENQTITPAWEEIPQVPLTFSVVDKTPGTEGGTNGTITAVVVRKGLEGYAQSVETSGADAQTIEAYRDSVVTFISNPDEGYTIGTRKLDGNVQREQIVLHITAEHEKHVVEIQFDPVGEEITYGFDRNETTDLADMSAKFTASGGSPSDFASGNTASADGSITFTVSNLNAEYQIEGWYVNGVKQAGTVDTYTMTVTQNVGAIVRVKLVPVQYTVTFSSDQGSITAKAVEFESDAGEITIGSGRALNSGSKVTFTAPDVTGYSFTGWTVNSTTSDETGQTLTIAQLRRDTTVKANYEMIIVNYAVTYGVHTDGKGTLTAAVGGTDVGASPADVNSGSRVVFTAAPDSGYQVKGWYSDETCTQPIAGTQAEQKTYIIPDLTGNVSVYVAFEPVPTYEITVDIIGTKQGTVTAAVNGQAADLSDGKLTVSRHDNVTLVATPNENQRLVAWALDNANRGNSSMILSLTDVTAAHAVTAEFGSTQSVTLTVNAEGGNGSVTTQLGYGDDLQIVEATNGYRADVGQTVKVTASPNSGYMVKSWTVNDEVQENLSNTLTIDSLTKSTAIAVEYETLVLHTIPATDGTDGYTITDVTKTPTDYGDASHIRGRGTVSFTVKSVEGQYLTELKVNNVDCLPDGESGDGISTPSGDVTVKKNNDGSYTVTVKNVRANIELAAASMKFQTVQGPLTTVPDALSGTYESVDALQSALRTQIKKEDSKATDDQTALLDIKLQYNDGTGWKDATADNFPTGGIRIDLLYEDLGNTDSSYTFTVIHMFTTTMGGHTIGEMETITPDKDGDGLHFTVTSLSPFAVGWTKTTTPPVDPNPGGGGSGGGGGGGGGGTSPVDPPEETKPCDGGADCPFHGYTDLDVTAWYHEAVDYALNNDLMGGFGKGLFGPNNSLTRAQLAQILYNRAGRPAVTGGSKFTDVASGQWYTDAIIWASQNGIVSGYGGEIFGPDDNITREQLAVMLWRCANSPAAANKELDFSDADETSSYALDAIRWAVANGIINGDGSGSLDPRGQATRAQAAQMLKKFIEVQEDNA